MLIELLIFLCGAQLLNIHYADRSTSPPVNSHNLPGIQCYVKVT